MTTMVLQVQEVMAIMAVIIIKRKEVENQQKHHH